MDPEEVKRALGAYLRSFSTLYGAENMVPKFHYAWHIPVLLKQVGWLPMCFVLERKHKGIKRYGNHVENTSGDWHKGVLRDASTRHFEMLCACEATRFGPEPVLLNPTIASAKVDQALRAQFALDPEAALLTSRQARSTEFEVLTCGDVVLVGHGPPILGKISLFASVDGLLVALLEQWRILEEQSKAWKCAAAPSDMPAACQLADVQTALHWAGTEIRTVLKPFRA